MFDINEYLSNLEYLVNIHSGQDSHEGITKVAEFFTEKFDGLGWNTTMHDLSPNTGSCLVCTNREAEQYDLMLLGHMDTVFTKDDAEKRPFTMDETKAYGPGAADMKHGSLLMYYLMRDLPKEVNDKLNIVVVFNPDEEIGSRYSRHLFIEYAKKTKYAYLYEGHPEDGTRCVERKGSLSFSVVIHGVSGHVGYTFTNGALNAVVEASRWAVRIHELQSAERNLNVNVTRIYGGDKMNVVPDTAGFSVNMRIPNLEEKERVRGILEQLKAEAAERGFTAEIPNFGGTPPFTQTEEGWKYIEHIKEVAASIGQKFETMFHGGISDANRIARFGPICIDGMGPSGALVHSDREYMVPDSVVPTYELSMALIKDLAFTKTNNR